MSDVALETLPEVVVAPAESPEAIAEETGMVPVSQKTLDAIRRLGVQMDTMGVITMTQGFLFLSQASIALALSKIGEGLEKAKEDDGYIDPVRAAQPLAQLARAMCNTVNTMKGPTHLGVAPGGPGAKKSFPAYTAIIVNQPKVEKT